MALLAAAAGACAVAAVLLIIAGLTEAPTRSPGRRPPSRLRMVLRSAGRPERRSRVLTATGAALSVLLVLGWPVAALAVGAAVYALPPMLSARAPARQIATLEAMAQWARRLAEVMGASRGLEQALADSARIAPEPVHEAVAMLADRLNNHANTEQALRAFADELDDPVGDLIACALILAAKRRGPGTRQALALLADAVEHEVLVRQDVEAERASLRTTLAVIVISVGALSVLFVASQTLAQPYGTPLGQAVLAVVAAIYGLGLCWMRRLSMLSTGSRFLVMRPPASASAQGAAS